MHQSVCVDEYTYCTCVISPPLIDKNQNFFTLTMKKLKKYIKIVYIRIFEGTGLKKKNKGNNQPGGILLSFSYDRKQCQSVLDQNVIYITIIFFMECGI